MLKVPKIAIIIPVYNREHLLAYTLDSIIVQSFTDWECIVVDDDSTDASFKVMEQYQKKDVRFKVYKRPNELKKGANACRNYGFTKSTAPFVKWFDSDDIMLSNHLDIAYQTLIEKDLDFVVTDTVNFDHITGDIIHKPYNFDRMNAVFSPEKYAFNQIGWITDDFLGTRESVQDIRFNENITDGDEYNFFIKFLNQSTKGSFINQVLTYRRLHEGSISIQNQENIIKYELIIATLKYQTAQDLVVYNDKKLIRWFLSGYMQYAYKLALKRQSVNFKKEAVKLIRNYFSFSNAVAFIIAIIMAKYVGKGYVILKYART
jgi:glycosyltransferase involved in cell wall biosynthesis